MTKGEGGDGGRERGAAAEGVGGGGAERGVGAGEARLCWSIGGWRGGLGDGV